MIFDYNQDYRGSKGSGIDVINNLTKYKVLEKREGKKLINMEKIL